MEDYSKKPNIILIILDCCRADHLSCFGYRKRITPNMDHFAKEGMIFLNAFSTSPWTVPSHASIFTGLYPFELGIDRKYIHLDDDFMTIADFLKGRGYRTIMISQNPVVGPSTNLNKGFEKYHFCQRSKFREYKVRNLMEVFKESITEEKGGNREAPFFMVLNFLNLHPPYFPPSRFFGGFHSPLLNIYNLLSFVLFKLKKSFQYENLFERINLNKIIPKLLNILYDQELVFLDHQIGEIILFLKRESLLEETMVMITSDHGEPLGEKGIVGHGCSLYDVDIRVPLLIRYPKVFHQDKVSQEMVSLKNIFYTLIDLSGDSLIHGKDGVVNEMSLSRQNKRDSSNDYIFGEVDRPLSPKKFIKYWKDEREWQNINQSKRCIRTNQFKYILYEDGFETLFNLSFDPGEKDNASERHPNELVCMRSKLNEVSTRENRRMRRDPNEYSKDELIKQLKALGYLD